MNIRIIPLTASLLTLISCHNEERNIIVRTPPFYSRHYSQWNTGNSDEVIQAARMFSMRHGMDFLLSRNGPKPGDFNATAASEAINIHALHVSGAGGGLDVFAIADHKPTQSDYQLVFEFRCRVALDCSKS